MLLLFDPGFEHNHLILEELIEEPCKFDEWELSGFVLLEEVINALVFFLKIRVDLPNNLVTTHAASDELFDNSYINGAIVISIASII